MTSDPIGMEGGINTYLYVEANPIRYIDPLGLRGACIQLVLEVTLKAEMFPHARNAILKHK